MAHSTVLVKVMAQQNLHKGPIMDSGATKWRTCTVGCNLHNDVPTVLISNIPEYAYVAEWYWARSVHTGLASEVTSLAMLIAMGGHLPSMQGVWGSSPHCLNCQPLPWHPKWDHQGTLLSVHVWDCGHSMRVDSWLPKREGWKKLEEFSVLVQQQAW